MFNGLYREHSQAIRTNKQTYKYAQHMLDTGHSYEHGTTVKTMQIMQVKGKGHLINTLNFFIYILWRVTPL
jgi:hypothetical protein